MIDGMAWNAMRCWFDLEGIGNMECRQVVVYRIKLQE